MGGWETPSEEESGGRRDSLWGQKPALSWAEQESFGDNFDKNQSLVGTLEMWTCGTVFEDRSQPALSWAGAGVLWWWVSLWWGLWRCELVGLCCRQLRLWVCHGGTLVLTFWPWRTPISEMHMSMKSVSYSVVTQSLLFSTPWTVAQPGSSVHGILQARILEWGAIPFSGESSRPGDRTWVSCFAGRFFTIWTTREVGGAREIFTKPQVWPWGPLCSSQHAGPEGQTSEIKPLSPCVSGSSVFVCCMYWNLASALLWLLSLPLQCIIT